MHEQRVSLPIRARDQSNSQGKARAAPDSQGSRPQASFDSHGSPLDVGCSWPVVQPGVLVLLVLEGWVGLDTGGDTRVAANYLLCLKKILFVVGKCFFVTLLKVLTRFSWHLRN